MSTFQILSRDPCVVEVYAAQLHTRQQVEIPKEFLTTLQALPLNEATLALRTEYSLGMFTAHRLMTALREPTAPASQEQEQEVPHV